MLRRDGFVSMRAGRKEGYIEIKTQIPANGNYLFVNADVKGTLAVEVLDDNGQPMEGFTKKDCISMKKSDKTKQMISWEKHPGVTSLVGKTVRLKFYLNQADIYAFWISAWQTGESGGYTGGGGPGLSDEGIDTPMDKLKITKYIKLKKRNCIMEKIIGLINAPFTPFYENGEVNYEPIEAYAKLLVKNGLKGVFINGSSGEGYMLTDEERMKLAERWMEVAPDGFKVIVHVGSCCVKSSRMLAEHAQKIGAWGIGAMAPPFPKIGRIEELVKYCEEIAAGAPKLPFYYYHIPAFNGAFLSMLAFLKAVENRIPNFTGIKYTFESLYEYNQCRLYKDGKFDMLHGQDETILPCLAMGGAQGGIGGTTNYNGINLVGIIDAWKAGELEQARELQNFSQEVINVICHFRGNIVGGKRIMKLIGLDLGGNRTPFQNMTADEEKQMKAELEEIRFFERCNKF